MEKILVDTDVIIDFLRGYQKRIKQVFQQIEDKKIKAYISWINVIEIYSGIDAEEKELILSELFSLFEIISCNWSSSKLAGELRKTHNLSLADSLIASLSLTNRLKLFTFNKRDFSKIKGVSFYNP